MSKESAINDKGPATPAPEARERKLRGTIRPVHVDAAGRLHDCETGEPLNIPGLEPEAILEGMADFDAGRYRPFEEIQAEIEAEEEARGE